jgi:hypothetical protein
MIKRDSQKTAQSPKASSWKPGQDIMWGDMMIAPDHPKYNEYASRLKAGAKPPGGMPLPPNRTQPKLDPGIKPGMINMEWGSPLEKPGQKEQYLQSTTNPLNSQGQTLGSTGGLFDSRPSTTPANPSQSFLMAEQDKLTAQPQSQEARPNQEVRPNIFQTGARNMQPGRLYQGTDNPAPITQAMMRQNTGPIVAGDGEWRPGPKEYHQIQKNAAAGDPTAIRQLTQATPPDKDIYGNKIPKQSSRNQSKSDASTGHSPLDKLDSLTQARDIHGNEIDTADMLVSGGVKLGKNQRADKKSASGLQFRNVDGKVQVVGSSGPQGSAPSKKEPQPSGMTFRPTTDEEKKDYSGMR